MSLFSQVVVAAAVAVASTLVYPAAARAQDEDRYKTQAHDLLMHGDLVRDALNHNYRVLNDGYRQGYIEVGAGKYQTTTFHLESGYVYRFLGACDEDCRDMDFALIGDPEGVVAEDTDPDATPGIQYSPSRTGDYTLVAKMPKCNAFFGCYWAVVAVGK